ncbi:COX15/CtaA family protein [Mumia sp. zg.B53]|uniref:COX15/CtaA family protein n=1 Tax=unclassified Mumia TaxID=2621872 RepID=UPI001C6E29F5|nr:MULTISPECIES: COX15/CtaA family protein [unclassified Mumia]MBW9208779.1 COX15/CtaA family protein [Mumia sp. zg.B21]MBW9213390.1 COX15/CtaA family protein [Mumia sp. zg.B53]
MTLIEKFRNPTDGFVRGWAWASLVANIGIIVTGAAVRLTASGLGCPTWPRCTDASFVPHDELGAHGLIEFGNRLLTFVLVAVAIATWFAVRAWRPRRPHAVLVATLMALGISLQAGIGGITVLVDLNAWVVAIHLAVSIGLVSLSTVLLRETSLPPGPSADLVPSPVRVLGWLTYAVMWATVMIGTVVTGAGPHAGDPDTARNGFDPVSVTQLHADAVFLLLGLSVGLLLAYKAVGAPATAVRAAVVLLAVELGQGLIGFVQYFTDLPIVLVGLHLLGAGILAAAATWATLESRGRAPVPTTRTPSPTGA